MGNVFRKHSYILILIILLIWASYSYLQYDVLMVIGPTTVLLLICDILVKTYNLKSIKWFNFVTKYFYLNIILVIAHINFHPKLSHIFDSNFIIVLIIISLIWLQLIVSAIIFYELINKIFLTKYSKNIQRSYLVGVPILVMLALYINATRTW